MPFNSRLNWFEFKGARSDNIKTLVENMTAAPRPERRIDIVTIPGLDGELTMSDDTYNTTPIVLICRWPNSVSLRMINAWLVGKGDLILSLEPDKKYKARVTDILNYEKLGVYWKASVLFIAQPFAYEAQPQLIALTASGSIHNLGSRWSMPIITVYGAGELTIGDYTLIVESTSGEDSVTINSEIEECYYSGTSRNNKVSGDFPRIEQGATEITLGAGITKVEIQGNWRWY